MTYPPLRWRALLLALLLTACGDDPAPEIDTPSWAKVAPEQIAGAKKHGVPVAFENDLGMRFVLIPAGTFLMGSPEDEEGRSDDETQHEVTISKPFYIQITEVTNRQYRRFRPEHDCTFGENYEWPGQRIEARVAMNGERQPATGVSWRDARDFGVWLTSDVDRREYRLPTEAEWECACRAGATTRFWCGDTEEDLVRVAWYSNTDNWDSLATNPVAEKAASPWGLHDMHGNVAEHCRDWYGEYADHRLRDPHGPSHSVRRIVRPSGRVHRGGSFIDPWLDLRSAARGADSEGSRFCNVGFRLVSPVPE